MSQLQIGLIVAGVVLVVCVIVYNWLQERRIRRRLEATHAPKPARAAADQDVPRRVEPTLHRAPEQSEGESLPADSTVEATPARAGVEVEHDPDWRPPMEPLPPLPDAGDGDLEETLPAAARARTVASEYSAAAAPDAEIECIATLQPARPAGAGSLAAGLHARLGKTVRWYGRRDAQGAWQRLASDTRGEYAEFAACMLLADRAGPADRNQIDAFLRLVEEIAPTLPAAFVAPDADAEAERAEALDRLCAELDIQIGLTVQKVPPDTIAGTRLRGVAEAAGFRLAPSGRFEWVQEETGVVLFTLQSIANEPFTLDFLRLGSVTGIVFVLDVPRVTDPPRAFDQMKLAAKRMAKTLDAEVVDDNRRLLNDAGLAAIRAQVAGATSTLRSYHIEPGSPRALKLFSA